MKQYLNQIKRLNDQLITKKILIFEKVIYVWVLNNFFENYESLITTITQSIRVNDDASIKLDDLFANLIDESKRVKARDFDATALSTRIIKKRKFNKFYDKNRVIKQKIEKSLEKCAHCHKKKHKENKC